MAVMANMLDKDAAADLVASIRAPWHATVGECLERWAKLKPREQSHSYLVLREEAGARRTLNALAIANIVQTNDGDQMIAR